MSVVRSLPEALAKFPNSNLSLQLSEHTRPHIPSYLQSLLPRAPSSDGPARVLKFPFKPSPEEFNRVTYNTSANLCPSRLHVAPPFLQVRGPVQTSKLQPGLVQTSNWQLSPVLSQEHYYVKTQACQTNMQTIITLSILTPAALMSLSSVAKRPVQQAVVASHVAAESHHEGYKGIQWDVWLSRPSVNIFDCLLSFKLHITCLEK